MKTTLRKLVIGLVLAGAGVGCEREAPVVSAVAGGDPRRGPATIERYGCTACHVVPGVAGPPIAVGPSLDHVASRPRIGLGGGVENTPDNLVRWLRDPPSMTPGTAMPKLNLGEGEARDVAAYLYTLK